MKLFRITLAPYASDLSGRGAELYGGRFNSVGTRVVYTSESRALALLETLAHRAPDIDEEEAYRLITIEVPKGAPTEDLAIENLVEHWRDGSSARRLQLLGDAFVERNEALLLRVPSVIMPEERNVIINPAHVDFASVKLGASRALTFDARL